MEPTRTTEGAHTPSGREGLPSSRHCLVSLPPSTALPGPPKPPGLHARPRYLPWAFIPPHVATIPRCHSFSRQPIQGLSFHSPLSFPLQPR